MGQYRIFLSYVIPSILAFALSGIYAIADGFFVGNSIGDIGLSTINVAYPVVSFVQSLGTGIGMGGAVLYSIRMAMGEKQKAAAYMDTTLQLLFCSSVIVTVLVSLLLTPVLRLLGAENELMVLGKEYLRIIVLGAVFQIFGTGLLPLIRNNGGSTFAMGTMIFGFLTNIFLDYLFVWNFAWGVAGAALATVIGQAVTMAGSFYYLIQNRLPLGRAFWKDLSLFGRIVRIGLAPFGINMSPILSLIFINRFSMIYDGEPAVACYACISYVITILYLLMQGTGDGSQPLMSQYFGEGKWEAVKQIRFYAYTLSEGIILMGAGLLFWVREDIGMIFGASLPVASQVAKSLPIFLIGVMFLSFVRIITSGFYATANHLFSYILVYEEPVLLFILLLILPRFGGQTYIWWSMTGAQVITAVTAFGLKTYSDRQYARKGVLQ